MNTTMADGAAQRLVAQIGEALFGQPGLTLMELAEKVKGMRLASSHFDVEAMLAACVPGGRIVDPQVVADRIRHWFDAQPSPAGQGDVLDLNRVLSLADVHAEESREDGTRLLDRGGLLAFAQDVAADLAGRQPVGQEPITVEAVAEIFDHPEYGLSLHWLLENGIGELQVGDVLMVSDRRITDEDGSGEVYAAPPAQAVDLVQIIDQIAQQWDGCSYDAVGETIDIGQAIRSAGKRLADSKAPTNG